MTTPKSPQQLAHAIESLVASYVDESRRAAQLALDRSFSGSPATIPKSTRNNPAGRPRTSRMAKRRSAEELVELGERLYELICARPGESMTVFADETGVAAHELHRPMSKLKAEGRIRSAGERNLTRYFPAVGRRSASADV